MPLGTSKVGGCTRLNNFHLTDHTLRTSVAGNDMVLTMQQDSKSSQQKIHHARDLFKQCKVRVVQSTKKHGKVHAILMQQAQVCEPWMRQLLVRPISQSAALGLTAPVTTHACLHATRDPDSTRFEYNVTVGSHLCFSVVLQFSWPCSDPEPIQCVDSVLSGGCCQAANTGGRAQERQKSIHPSK